MEQRVYDAVKEPLAKENIELVGVHLGEEDGWNHRSSRRPLPFLTVCFCF